MSDVSAEQIYYWRHIRDSFIEQVVYKNRFFGRHPLLDCVDRYIPKNTVTIPKNTKLYRARICDPEIIKENKYIDEDICALFFPDPEGFDGYNEAGCFPPESPDKILPGRVNCQFIRCLYTATDHDTAVAEVRPYLGAYVSVALLQVQEPLEIVQYVERSLNGSTCKEEIEEIMFNNLLSNFFSLPTIDSARDNIPSQYLASYIKGKKRHGIGYSSSQKEGGLNIAIFNPDSCKALSSKVVKIKKIEYSTTKCLSNAALGLL